MKEALTAALLALLELENAATKEALALQSGLARDDLALANAEALVETVGNARKQLEVFR